MSRSGCVLAVDDAEVMLVVAVSDSDTNSVDNGCGDDGNVNDEEGDVDDTDIDNSRVMGLSMMVMNS